MDERDIVPADEPLLRRMMVEMPGGFSEHCAANLIVYRRVHQYRLRLGDWPVIAGTTYDGQRHAMPLFALTPQNLTNALAQLGPGECLYPVSEQFVASVPAGAFTVSVNTDDSDYVFDTASLATLAGSDRKLRRLQARKFAAFDPAVEPLDQATIPEALVVLERWHSEIDRPWGETDAAACREAVAHYASLGLAGLIVRKGPNADDDAVAMIIGAALPDGSASILFAKALRSAPGAFPFIVSAFAQQYQGRFSRLNFEQDLGRSGFRQAKRAYGPLRMLHKYRLFRCN